VADRVHHGGVSEFHGGDVVGRARVDADDFARLAVQLHDTQGVEETVEAVMAFALHALGCTYAGIVLKERSEPWTIASDPVVEQIYRFQIESGDGPMMAAYLDDEVVRVRDSAEDVRWPEWAALAAALGLRSVLHLPLKVGPETVGVLSAYDERPDVFTADDEAVAHILARHASVAVASAREVHELGEALDARKVVGQAMGILMERFDLDSDRAFAVLRRYSQDHNIKLRDVAQRLIETRSLSATSGDDADRPRTQTNA
jgi:GAF domain-containing protein